MPELMAQSESQTIPRTRVPLGLPTLDDGSTSRFLADSKRTIAQDSTRRCQSPPRSNAHPPVPDLASACYPFDQGQRSSTRPPCRHRGPVSCNAEGGACRLSPL